MKYIFIALSITIVAIFGIYNIQYQPQDGDSLVLIENVQGESFDAPIGGFFDSAIELDQIQEKEANAKTSQNQPKVEKKLKLRTKKRLKKTLRKKRLRKTLPKKNKSKKQRPKNDYEPMSFQFLSSYDISDDLTKEEIKKIPEYIKKLEGKVIGIAGYMVPTDMMASKISQFLLVNMNDTCCFGGTPKVTEFIFSEMHGETTKYTNFPVAVIGVFSINKNLDDKVLYRLNVQKIIPSRDKIFWDIMKKAPTFPGTNISFSYEKKSE